MAGLKFDITGNANGFVSATRQAEAAAGNLTRRVTKEGASLDSLFKKIATSAAAIGAGFSTQKIVSDIVRVRGEFQQLEIAMETMLGNKSKADSLMNQLVQTAAKTPFGLTDIAQGAKQLLAYGTASEEVNETLVRLGNIASGLSIPLNDLVYLYGTTMTQGRLFTQDLRQFMGRGVPIADELAKQFGVAKDKIDDMVTAGRVGFPEVQKAIMSLTNEGGKFYNLMEKQSSSLTGQMSNLEDAIDMMLNSIGQEMQDALSGGISLVSNLVENYEKVGKIIAAVAGTYGTYKAAVLAVAAAEKVQAIARLAAIKQTSILSVATGALTKKMALLNAVMKANPYVLIATTVVGLGAAMWALADNTTAAEKAQKRYNEKIEEASRLEAERKQKVEDALNVARDASIADGDRVAALELLKKEYKVIFNDYDLEKLKLADILELKKQIAEEDRKKRSTTLEESYAEGQDWLNKYRSTYNKGGKAFRKAYEEKQEEQKLLRSEYTAQKVEDYIATVKGQSTQYLQDVLEIAQKASAGNGQFLLEGTKVFAKGVVDLTQLKTLNVEGENLVAVIDAINTELAKRNEVVPTYDDAYKAAEAAWKKEKDALDKIKKNRSDYTQKQYEEQVILEKEKRKAFEDLGGDTKDKTNELTKDKKESEKLQKELLRQQEDLDNQREQAEINALSNEGEKRRRQMALDHKMELQQIERQKEDFIEKAIERDRALYEAEGNKPENFNEAASRAKNTAYADAVYAGIENSTKAKHLKEEQDAIEQLKLKYEDFRQAVTRIDQELQSDLAMMQDKDGNLLAGFTEENVNIAIKNAEDAKDALAISYVEENDDFLVFVNTLTHKTLKELELMLATAKQELETLEASDLVDPETLARARAEVAKLEQKISEVKVDKGTKEASVNWSELNTILKDSAATFNELGSIIPGVAGQMLSGMGNIASSAVSMANGIHAIGEAASAAEKASAILAIVSAALKVVSTFTKAAEENKKANIAAADAARDYALAIDEITYAERRAESSNFFGTNSFKEMQENVKIANEQLAKLKTNLEIGTGWEKQEQIDFVSQTSSWATFSKKYRDFVKELYNTGNMALVSDLRSGWQKFWGIGNDNLEVISLEDFIDAEGMLDTQRLEDWYKAYGDGLSEEQKKLVEDLLSSWESYYDTLDQLDAYVEGLVGNAADDIADKWITAFEETGSAITDLKDVSSDFAKSFAKDMLKNILATEVFNDAASQTLLNLIKNGDTAGAVNFYNQLVEQAELLGKNATEVMQSLGIATAGTESTRSATTSTTVQATQESIDALSGRTTAIQTHTFSINERIKEMVSISSQILASVKNIEINTERLSAMETSLDTVNSNLSDIVTKGIVVKR